ncbi:hypothetical protein PTSG_01852 [Salpingoeca rosetta]|uniref:Reticulon domain-containing protein n=1 Tax=Salpingoeca rosetta (strain ATCC 50818 / BSB-021) TaxID=946362 RepID=F2TZ51_SALR5|nr:uncharacterized protein PTSG_01852 [Salpingoeca rosetta]EGD78875.1 hypothetical protein PTSG_01852 [Salpingoeca rosetta]|eukprot:XP_004997831.1 hypothetical protein PTSG_01852 [Salpingoeca rosetta]
MTQQVAGEDMQFMQRVAEWQAYLDRRKDVVIFLQEVACLRRPVLSVVYVSAWYSVWALFTLTNFSIMTKLVLAATTGALSEMMLMFISSRLPQQTAVQRLQSISPLVERQPWQLPLRSVQELASLLAHAQQWKEGTIQHVASVQRNRLGTFTFVVVMSSLFLAWAFSLFSDTTYLFFLVSTVVWAPFVERVYAVHRHWPLVCTVSHNVFGRLAAAVAYILSRLPARGIVYDPNARVEPIPVHPDGGDTRTTARRDPSARATTQRRSTSSATQAQDAPTAPAAPAATKPAPAAFPSAPSSFPSAPSSFPASSTLPSSVTTRRSRPRPGSETTPAMTADAAAPGTKAGSLGTFGAPSKPSTATTTKPMTTTTKATAKETGTKAAATTASGAADKASKTQDDSVDKDKDESGMNLMEELKAAKRAFGDDEPVAEKRTTSAKPSTTTSTTAMTDTARAAATESKTQPFPFAATKFTSQPAFTRKPDTTKPFSSSSSSSSSSTTATTKTTAGPTAAAMARTAATTSKPTATPAQPATKKASSGVVSTFGSMLFGMGGSSSSSKDDEKKPAETTETTATTKEASNEKAASKGEEGTTTNTKAPVCSEIVFGGKKEEDSDKSKKPFGTVPKFSSGIPKMRDLEDSSGKNATKSEYKKPTFFYGKKPEPSTTATTAPTTTAAQTRSSMASTASKPAGTTGYGFKFSLNRKTEAEEGTRASGTSTGPLSAVDRGILGDKNKGDDDDGDKTPTASSTPADARVRATIKISPESAKKPPFVPSKYKMGKAFGAPSTASTADTQDEEQKKEKTGGLFGSSFFTSKEDTDNSKKGNPSLSQLLADVHDSHNNNDDDDDGRDQGIVSSTPRHAAGTGGGQLIDLSLGFDTAMKDTDDIPDPLGPLLMNEDTEEDALVVTSPPRSGGPFNPTTTTTTTTTTADEEEYDPTDNTSSY